MTFTHDALDFTKGNLPHPIVQTCSTWTHCTDNSPEKPLQLGSHCTGTPQKNLFNLDLTVQGPPNKLFKLGPQCAGTPVLDMFKLFHYETCTVVKLDAGILLECFLVVMNIKRQVLEHRFEYLYFCYTSSPTCNVPL